MGFKAAPQSDHLLKLVYQFSIADCVSLQSLLTYGIRGGRNAPFFIAETAYGDIVNANLSATGRLEFVDCVKPSNYRAISVILLSPEVRGLLIDDVQGTDCIVEYGKFRGFDMLAIAIPHTTDYAPIKASLEAYEKSGKLSFAELVA